MPESTFIHRSGFFRLLAALLNSGYSDVIVSEMNRTLTVRLLVTLAKPIGWLLPLRNRSSLFFFFPFLHVGGAERVHADIVACLADEKPWVVFTKKPANTAFRHLFERGARLFNLWPFCKYLYPLSVGVAAGFINRHRNPTVFGANSLFYYLMVPYLKPQVRCIDLIHAFGAGVEDFSLYAAQRLDSRVVINSKTLDDLRVQYGTVGVDSGLHERIVLIENRVDVPERYPAKRKTEKLRALFVGRGAEEKRVHLIGKVATLCRLNQVPVEFIIVGDTFRAVAPEDRESCFFSGEITDMETLKRIYDETDLLVLTSSREGFPMVIMEAMAHGAVPITTDVGGISVHVKQGVNGWLIENSAYEERIVSEFYDIIVRMCADRPLFESISRAAYKHACEYFSGEKFCSAYRLLMFGQ